MGKVLLLHFPASFLDLLARLDYNSNACLKKNSLMLNANISQLEASSGPSLVFITFQTLFYLLYSLIRPHSSPNDYLSFSIYL